MYPGVHAERHPDQPALIMATSGATLTFAEFEANANRLAHLFRSLGLRRGDHVAMFMENHLRYFETMAAAERERPLLHVHQLVPHGRRGRLHRRRLRRQGVHHDGAPRSASPSRRQR